MGEATNRRPTLRDVAAAAGVTPAAVSYVVTGRTDQVGAETLERITEAIKTLRYKPQRRGRSLKLNREFAIGLVILDPDPHFLADPFTTHIASGLSNALVDPGYSLVVSGARTLGDLERFLSRTISVDALAVIVSGPSDIRHGAYGFVEALRLPVVVVQDHAPRRIDDACAIFQDDKQGAEMLTRHLLERGAKTFLFVCPDRPWPAMERREAGIRAVLGDRHPLVRLECREQDHEATLGAIGSVLDGGLRPDAIMGGNDQIAIAALKALARRKIRAGKQIKVTGFNNFSFRAYADPALTSVTSVADNIGQSIADSLLARLETGRFRRRQITLPVSLVLGETT